MHIRIDLGDIYLLGLHFKQTYLDGSMLFGYRVGSGIFGVAMLLGIL